MDLEPIIETLALQKVYALAEAYVLHCLHLVGHVTLHVAKTTTFCP